MIAAALALLTLLTALPAVVGSPALGGIPMLQKSGSTTRLMVDGQPLVMLAGELHNSSSSSLASMEPIWPRLAGLNLNTVIASIS